MNFIILILLVKWNLWYIDIMDNICKMKMMIWGDCKMIDKKLILLKMIVFLFLIVLIVFIGMFYSVVIN